MRRDSAGDVVTGFITYKLSLPKQFFKKDICIHSMNNLSSCANVEYKRSAYRHLVRSNSLSFDAIKHQSLAAKDRVNGSKNNNEQGLVHYSRHLVGISLNLHNSIKEYLISS